VNEIEVEVDRLWQGLWRMLARGGGYVSEVPFAIHERGTDSGHGLGGPAFHPRFTSYLRDAGVCLCPETKPDGTPQPHYCDRRFEGTGRMRPAKPEPHPRRLKRAFRQLRLLAPYDQYHMVYLVVARGWTFPQAVRQVDAARLTRGDVPLTGQDAVVMLVAGLDILESAW
jgi:hypothetical protein